MKTKSVLFAILLLGMTFHSCTKSDLTEEETLLELATDGKEEKPEDKPES